MPSAKFLDISCNKVLPEHNLYSKNIEIVTTANRSVCSYGLELVRVRTRTVPQYFYCIAIERLSLQAL